MSENSVLNPGHSWSAGTEDAREPSILSALSNRGVSKELQETRLPKAIRVGWLLLLLFSSVSGRALAQQEVVKNQFKAGPTLNALAVLLDATSSTDAPTPQGASRRGTYLDATRALIRAAERANVRLVVARLCGLAETVWDAPVRRRDFRILTTAIQSSLSSCAPSTTVLHPAQRGGTDFMAGLHWLSHQPEEATLVIIGDGLHQPVRREGNLAQKELYAALDRLPGRIRARLWWLGVDEAVRDEIKTRVPRTFGLFDIGRAVEQLAGQIQGGRP